MSDGFSSEQLLQLEAIVEQGVRKGFADAGLRIDDGASEDEARKDFAFIRVLKCVECDSRPALSFGVVLHPCPQKRLLKGDNLVV